MAPQKVSAFASAKFYPPDAIFELTRKYVADKSPNKVNLGQGTYRDENGNPWVMPSVQMAKRLIIDSGHEYLPILGLQSFRDEAVRMLLHTTGAIEKQKVASCQALSGTGALFLTGLTLKKARTGIDTIYLTDPTWSNHQSLFESLDFKIKKLPYYDGRGFDFERYVEVLNSADRHSAVVFHACAHNPTGCDPSKAQWTRIAEIVKRRGIFPIFDAAYLGFNSGSIAEDAWAIRHFVQEMAVETAICMSFAKNMGLYGERVGMTVFVTESPDTRQKVASILENVQRSTVSNPPAYGARIAATVLGNAEIRCQWSKDLITMSRRIQEMRTRLFKELERLRTPGNWSRLLKQTGMFGYTALSTNQIGVLQERFHIYMPRTSRVSIAGLNDSNVAYVARAINTVMIESS